MGFEIVHQFQWEKNISKYCNTKYSCYYVFIVHTKTDVFCDSCIDIFVKIKL